MLLIRMQNFQMQFLLATYFVCKYLNHKPAVFIQGLPDGKVEVIKLVVDADDEIFEFFTLLSRVRRNGYYNESIWAIYMISFKVQVRIVKVALDQLFNNYPGMLSETGFH